MNDKQIEKLMKVLIGISAFLILAGALFKLEHYANGDLLLYIGIISSLLFGNIEIYRLRKIVKKLEDQNSRQ